MVLTLYDRCKYMKMYHTVNRVPLQWGDVPTTPRSNPVRFHLLRNRVEIPFREQIGVRLNQG